jgi:GntR family transcriptional regulator/MocR family aminotransferase
MLSPGLRVAWLIPPRHLVNEVRETLARSQEAVDLVTGAALTHFMESGALIRHLARASRTYSVRRRAFVAAVERYLPQCQILGVDAGLHVCLVLPDGIDASLVVLGLRRSGIALDAIDTYLVEPRRSSTLICNFANLPESKAALIVRSMASVIAEVSGRWPSRRDGFPQRLAAR